MKKSTITKILCLVILCVMVLPFVISCGSKCTITFDANGGTVSQESIKVKKNNPIGQLPTPKREGFEFTGWYDSDDLRQEDQIKKSTFAMYDMVLVAGWKQDANKAAVNFDLAGGNINGEKKLDIVYVDKYSNISNKLPVDPTHELGATFLGWYDDNGARVTAITKVTDDMNITAKWSELVQCGTSGSYVHNWGGFNYDDNEPTCTDDGKAVHKCMDCGYEETIPGKPALGHDYATGWTYGTMEQSRVCDRCKREEKVKYIELNDKVSKITVTGDVYGPDNKNCLFNGNWDEGFGTTFSGKGGTVIVEIEFTEAITVDWVYVKGADGPGYEFEVLEDGAAKYTQVGVGSFGEVVGKFNLKGKTITKAKFTMASSGTGGAYWQEMSFTKLPEGLEE